MHGENESLKKEVEEKSEKIKELLNLLNEAREAQSEMECTFRKELAAQENLSNVYKSE